MSTYEVSVAATQSTCEEDVYGPSTYGVIEVKPPINIGFAFGDIVRGQGRTDVNISHIMSDAERTLLSAWSHRKYVEDVEVNQQNDIELLAVRASLAVNAEDTATLISMKLETPFPVQQFVPSE